MKIYHWNTTSYPRHKASDDLGGKILELTDKFVEIFIPWNSVAAYVPFDVPAAYVAHFYGIVFTLFAMFYSILGGMHSIVLGDLIKYLIMTVACIAIAVIAMTHLHSGNNALAIPEGWLTPSFSWNLNLDWTSINSAVNDKIKSDGYSLFGAFFMMMLFKGIFASFIFHKWIPLLPHS